MGSRSASLQTKVVALLLSLTALWAFAAWVTLRDGLNLLGVQTLNNKVFEPSEPLLLELQVERRMTLAYLGKPSGQQQEALVAERQKTVGLAEAFKKSVDDWQTDLVSSAELTRRISDVSTGLDGLAATRGIVDDRTIDRSIAADAYTKVIDSIFLVYESLGNLDDQEIAKNTAALTQMERARELISQEDALLAGVLAVGKMTGAEYTDFIQLVGARRYLIGKTVPALFATDRARYEQMAAGEPFARFQGLEDRLISSGRPGTRVPINPADWRNAVEFAHAELGDVVRVGGDGVVDRVTPVAIGVVVRVALAAGLGLLAVIASVIVSITTARSLVRQLERLREAAWQLANERLPAVVSRLGRGEEVDVATEAPPLAFGDDQIGQVGQAFNAVQETAVRTAVEQAELRRSVRDVFLSIARRSQALVHRQLTLLDAMERREQDAEELEDLFRVDHLATRMRRNAENLIVLSGSTPGRAWRRNVPMIDVVRGAVAEVEDYTRVTVLPFGPVALTGRAVGDVIHLLAELIENALSFSPPHTSVEVQGQLVANGYVIEIEDRGLGMSEEDLGAANDRIVDLAAEFNLSNASQLGLFVVSRLTERHGVRVQLKESPYGGTTAVVLIPLGLVTDDGSDGSVPGGDLTGQAAAAVGAGRLDDHGRPGRPPAAVGAGSVAVANPSVRRVSDAVPPLTGATSTDGATVPRSVPDPGPKQPVNPLTPGVSNAARVDAATAPSTEVSATDRSLPVRRPAATRPASDQSPLNPQQRQAVQPPPTAAPADRTAAPKAAAGDAARSPDAKRTASGLPLRVRQASITPALRDAPEPDGPDGPGGPDEDTPRVPDRVRQLMSSYQSGTRRGRTEAARLLVEQNEVSFAGPAGTSGGDGRSVVDGSSDVGGPSEAENQETGTSGSAQSS